MERTLKDHEMICKIGIASNTDDGDAEFLYAGR